MDENNKEVEKISRLAAFTEFNPRPVVEVDSKGVVVYENLSSKITFPDLKKKGIKHAYLFDFKNIAKLLREGKEEYFSREIKIEARWFRHFFYYMPPFNSIVVYGLDITEKKESDRELQKSELRYSSLFNKMSEGYCLNEIILDKNGKPVDYRFLDMNPAFEKITGLKRKNIITKTIKQLLPGAELQWIKDYGSVALTGKPLHIERYDKEKDRYYEVFVYKPEHMQFAIFYLDITHLKLIEEEKNNFISIMSHELRNPLTSISASSQLLNTYAKNDDPIENASIKKYADVIERQSKNMAKLLDDLLDVSRLSQKKITLDKKVLNISEIIHHGIETTSSLIKRNDQKLSVILPQQPLYIEADPVRLEQIIINLITNASKYTPPKGRIKIEASLQKNNIEITVKDTGIGIKRQEINKIFELFNRSENKIEGLGIGLAITKHLVAMHEGTIKAKSKGKNKGSEFIIEFPFKELKNITPPQELRAVQNDSSKKPKVLIIEDNKDISDLLSKILQLANYETKVVNNGFDIVNVYKTFEPQAAVIDIGLPGISGYEIAKELRKQETQGKKVTLIALTGYGQHKNKIMGREAGFDHYLVKPIDMNSLIKLLP